MSMYVMRSENLIDSVKRRAMLPKTQNTFTNQDFLAFADEEMDLGLIPMILQMHEDYLLYTEKVNIVGNTNRYPIPYRAIGNKLREVSFEDSSGNVYEMTRISVADLPFYNYQAYNRPYAFYVENNEIVLVPIKNYYMDGTKLRMTYYMRPNSLVMSDEVGEITSINTTTGEIQLSNMPENFKITSLFDFIATKSPNKTLGFDLIPTSVNSVSKTVSFNPADLPKNLVIGDILCLATQTSIPQVPSDLHVILAHRVACRCLEALGDAEGLAQANAKLGEMEVKAQSLIDNRVEDAPKKITNRHTALRASTIGRRNRFRGF